VRTCGTLKGRFAPLDGARDTGRAEHRRRRLRRKATGADGARSNGHGNSGELGSGQPEAEREQVARQTSETPTTSEPGYHPHGAPAHRRRYAENMVFLMRLPFLYAHTLAKTNKKWLQKRHRSRWWKRGKFPRVPRDTIQDVDLKEVPELIKKMVPLGVLFFCATFNLCILQNLKDSLIVTNLGAETLPFLASFGVLPLSVAFMGFYNKLVARVPFKSVFYLAILPLVAAYTFFSFAVLPASQFLHPHGFFQAFASAVPVGLHGLLKIVENWTFSTFFCVAELWGAVVISILFWSLANDVCTVDEAKTIYPLMGISANVALVMAGNFIKYVNSAFTGGSLQLSFNYLIGAVVAMTSVMLCAKLFIDKNVKSQHVEDTVPDKKKKKGTFREGFAIMRNSPKIMNLALLVIGYSVSHRLFDVAWKGQLSIVYPEPQQYQAALADVSVWTGAATIISMVTGKFVFQYLGWGTAALATPVVMLLTGGVFFCSSFLFNMTSASLALAKFGALAGNITQVACKAAKYSLFDPAKEMVYIEMDRDEKRKGKPAVDLVGSQVGKSGASWLAQGLFLCFGSVAASIPVMMTVYFATLSTWIGSVVKLKGELKRTEEQRKLALKLKEEEGLSERQQAQQPQMAVVTLPTEVRGVGPTPHQHLANGNGHSQVLGHNGVGELHINGRSNGTVVHRNGASEGKGFKKAVEEGTPKDSIDPGANLEPTQS